MLHNVLNPLPAKEDREKAVSILTNAFAIASAGIAALKTMESIIPAAAQTVETASQKLTEHFITLTQSIQNRGTANSSIHDTEVLEAIKGITTEMQFQDRNTQIAQNAVVMMERCRLMLEDVQGAMANVLYSDPKTQENVAGAVETILSAIRLSDIRTSFKDTLAEMNIDYNDGLPPVAENSNNDIELF